MDKIVSKSYRTSFNLSVAFLIVFFAFILSNIGGGILGGNKTSDLIVYPINILAVILFGLVSLSYAVSLYRAIKESRVFLSIFLGLLIIIIMFIIFSGGFYDMFFA